MRVRVCRGVPPHQRPLHTPAHAHIPLTPPSSPLTQVPWSLPQRPVPTCWSESALVLPRGHGSARHGTRFERGAEFAPAHHLPLQPWRTTPAMQTCWRSCKLLKQCCWLMVVCPLPPPQQLQQLATWQRKSGRRRWLSQAPTALALRRRRRARRTGRAVEMMGMLGMTPAAWEARCQRRGRVAPAAQARTWHSSLPRSPSSPPPRLPCRRCAGGGA